MILFLSLLFLVKRELRGTITDKYSSCFADPSYIYNVYLHLYMYRSLRDVADAHSRYLVLLGTDRLENLSSGHAHLLESSYLWKVRASRLSHYCLIRPKAISFSLFIVMFCSFCPVKVVHVRSIYYIQFGLSEQTILGSGKSIRL